MEYKVLLIEDDSQIREIIGDSFMAKSENSMRLFCAEDGVTGLEMALSEEFDLVILDIMLPGIDGFSVMRSIRKQSDIPVIFLTARTREDDVLYGYQLGCDDYITKPFSTAALYAKALALINRDKHMVRSFVKTCGAIEVDTRALTVKVSGEEVNLSPIEYKILLSLLENTGWVVERDTIIRKVWGSDYYGGTRVVDNHIKRLRRSLGEGGKQIKTMISKGYKLMEE